MLANRLDWGVTEQGFRRPSYAEILDAFEYQARERFTGKGRTPDLTVRSPIGIFLRIWAWIVNLLFQTLEDVYNSGFVDTAVGASLFQLGRVLGLTVLPAQRAGGYVVVEGTEGITVPKGLLVGTNAGIQFAVLVDAKIGGDGAVTVPIQCTLMGSMGNVAENTVTQVVTPIPGVKSVINPKEMTGGRSRETSEQYRDRYYQSVDFAGGVNAEAIKAEILQTVEGVLAAEVYENETDEVNAMGMPPHSVEAVVYSGLDHEIAAAIKRRKAAGIQTFGSTVVPVPSEVNSQIFYIRFSRPAGIPVWIAVEGLQVDEDRFPADGLQQIQNALAAHIGSNLDGGLSIGQNVMFNSLPCRVLGVPGVIDFDLTISPDGEQYSRNNILIGEREKAVTGPSLITIVWADSSQGGDPHEPTP